MTLLTSRSIKVRAARACVATCICGLSICARAAPSFHSDRDYPNLGLRIRVLGNSTPEPLPQYKTYAYSLQSGDETTRLDMFDPFELWYATQHAGQWRDEAGNVLILGRPTFLLPAFKSKHVPRENFDRAMRDPANLLDPGDVKSLTAWVGAFTGCAPKAPEPLRPYSFNLVSAFCYPTDNDAILIYTFRVKARKPSGQATPSDWFCAVVKIGDGTPKAKVRKDFESQFLAYVAYAPPTGSAASSGVQPRDLSSASPSGRTPAAVIPDHPSRAAARRSIANMKDWWFAETPEYIFLSDIRSTTGVSLVRELQVVMPALRNAFARLIPPFEVAGDVSVVRIYEEEDAYKQYVGKEMEWSIGAWIPIRRELVVLSQGKDRDKTMRIIKHEGFHQYLFYACNMAENAPWFNEGHACFFEAAEIDRQGRVELPEGERCSQLLANLETVAGQIPRLIRLDLAGFYAGSDEQRSLNYTAAWSLIYYLRKGVPLKKQPAYGSIMDRYLETLASTEDARAATAAAFEGVNMVSFQVDFMDFWKRDRNRARRFDPLADKPGGNR